MTETKNGSVSLFFLFTLLWSWAFWIPLAVCRVNVRSSPWIYIMELGGFAPSLMGLIFILRNGIYDRVQAKRTFLSFRRIGPVNLGFSLLSLILPFAAALAFDFLFFGTAPRQPRLFPAGSSAGTVLFVIASFIYSGPVSEEIGWRGFAARILNGRYGLLLAGLITGTVWSVWHWPLLFLNGQYSIESYFTYIPMHLLKHFSLSLVIGYFWIRTGGSVLIAMVMHMCSNMLHTVFLMATALVLLLIEKSDSERRPAWKR